MIQQAGHSVKPDRSEELLVIEAVIFFSEGGMAFMGYFTEFVV